MHAIITRKDIKHVCSRSFCHLDFVNFEENRAKIILDKSKWLFWITLECDSNDLCTLSVGVVHQVMSRQHCNVIILHHGANSPIHKNQTMLLRSTGSQEWSLISPKQKSQYKIEISINFSVYAYISKNLQMELNTLRTRIINYNQPVCESTMCFKCCPVFERWVKFSCITMSLLYQIYIIFPVTVTNGYHWPSASG